MWESYAFICANYVDADEIIIIGFSRGAFTARSVAGMISSIGLLTREGMDSCFPIFKNVKNWVTRGYKDPFPSIPFDNKPRGDDDPSVRFRLAVQGLGFDDKKR